MKSFYITKWVAVFGLFIMSAACDEDNDLVKSALNSPETTVVSSSVSSLSFQWEKVNNAVQYAYELTEKQTGELVKADVTTANSARFSGLKPATAYVLNVWAYADLTGNYSTSGMAVLEAVTPAIVTLQTPVAEVITGEGKITINWEAVENAMYYVYSYTLDGEEISERIEDTSVELRSLPSGEYTLLLYAGNEDEAFASSEKASVHFTVLRQELWRVKGTYHSCVLDEDFPVYLVAYDDNSYTLLDWYGVEGYNFDFMIDEDDEYGPMIITGDYEYDENSGYYKVPTGREGKASTRSVYPWSGYSNLEGDFNGGEITFYMGGDGKNDTFTWEVIPFTVDDLCVQWNINTTGIQYVEDPVGSFDITYSCNVTKVDENTIKIRGIYWNKSNRTVVAKVNTENRTLTFEPQQWSSSYWFANIEGEDIPVIGHIEADMTIVIEGWTAWYSGYVYFEDAKVVMSRVD